MLFSQDCSRIGWARTNNSVLVISTLTSTLTYVCISMSLVEGALMCLYRGCMTVILFFYTVITYLPIRSKYVPGIDFFCKIPVENNRFLCPSSNIFTGTIRFACGMTSSRDGGRHRVMAPFVVALLVCLFLFGG